MHTFGKEEIKKKIDKSRLTKYLKIFLRFLRRTWFTGWSLKNSNVWWRNWVKTFRNFFLTSLITKNNHISNHLKLVGNFLDQAHNISHHIGTEFGIKISDFVNYHLEKKITKLCHQDNSSKFKIKFIYALSKWNKQPALEKSFSKTSEFCYISLTALLRFGVTYIVLTEKAFS